MLFAACRLAVVDESALGRLSAWVRGPDIESSFRIYVLSTYLSCLGYKGVGFNPGRLIPLYKLQESRRVFFVSFINMVELSRSGDGCQVHRYSCRGCVHRYLLFAAFCFTRWQRLVIKVKE